MFQKDKKFLLSGFKNNKTTVWYRKVFHKDSFMASMASWPEQWDCIDISILLKPAKQY